MLRDGFVVGAGEAAMLVVALMLAEGRSSGAEVVVGVAGLGPTAAEAAGTVIAAAVVAGMEAAGLRFRASLSQWVGNSLRSMVQKSSRGGCTSLSAREPASHQFQNAVSVSTNMCAHVLFDGCTRERNLGSQC